MPTEFENRHVGAETDVRGIAGCHKAKERKIERQSPSRPRAGKGLSQRVAECFRQRRWTRKCDVQVVGGATGVVEEVPNCSNRLATREAVPLPCWMV